MDKAALPRPKITVAASQRLRPDPVSCESRGGGDGGISSDFKKVRARTHLSFLTVASRGRGTATHICGRDPAAAPSYAPVTTPVVVLLPQSRSRALVFDEKGIRGVMSYVGRNLRD